MMKKPNLWPAVVVALTLLGLGVVQFQWVRAGIVVEKQVFDRELRQLLESTGQSIAQTPGLAQDILALHRHRQKGQAVPKALRQSVREELEARLRSALEQQQKNMPFSIALTESIWPYPLLVSGRFEWSEAAAYRSYMYTFEGTMAEACNCTLSLHLQLRDFLPHLLMRLRGLLGLTGLGLGLLVLGFVLLVRKVRREQRLVAVKNDFINTLTHELKTPVFSSSLLLKLLGQALKTGQPVKALDYLDRLSSENQQLKLQIERVLELASLEQPAYELKRAPINVREWLDRTCKAFAPKAEARQGTLQWNSSAASGLLNADADHLASALNNLLDNALKYGGQPPAITVDAEGHGQQLTLRVQDNGPGVPKEEQAKVFRKFYRLHQSQVQGFGLGLSYVQQVAHLHGGAAGVQNAATGGAAFWLQLPDFEPGEADASPKQQKAHG